MKRKHALAKLLSVLLAIAFIRATPPADVPMARATADIPEITEISAAAEKPEIIAKSAVVTNTSGAERLFEKNADQRRAPASTTKLMTLLLACEMGEMDKMITVPDSASTVPADSTRVPVYPGQKMPFKDLVYSMMIKSGNDAANAIGTLLSGSVENFVGKMNSRAANLGLENTRFKNPHGYPVDGHYSTAGDMAKIIAAIIKNPTAMKILTARSYEMSDGRVLKNSYAILDKNSDYYYKYALGGKTGYSLSSGQCFGCIAKKNGETLISVVLYSGLSKADKWTDTKAILEYAFDKAA